ncbi:anaerobic sulfite reductase subunit AsrB [Aliivibrio sp. EL58]|uniref:anaerobic sulfite reductase subunit AsrB n=1 Tax=Aliivibrio sp. EL58 TaxID=2107582 RepID=UPI000EFAF6DD|nr:anaerobic sulfite reductase subunit AsrB [Aliivibrio sp. EL58]
MCKCENKLLPQAYKILEITKHTDIEWNYRVECDFYVTYGQFVELSLPLFGEAPISVSDFGEGYIDLLIRKVGKVTNELFSLKEGDSVWMRGAHGNGYPLEKYHHKHLIVFAGGTGVAPVKGLISHFCKQPLLTKFMDIVVGFKNDKAVLYKEEMKHWDESINLICTLDEASENPFYQAGLVTKYIDSLDLSNIKDVQLIVVGPPIMIKFVVQAFQKRGLSEGQIWVDYERRMACAVGKCGHCRIGDKYVCIDGPVFQYDEAQAMID